MTFYKDDPALKAIGLAPAHPIAPLPPGGTTLGAIARSYNAIGGLTDALSAAAAIDPMAALAVWYVESGGAVFVAGRPVLRFEVHHFWQYWGCSHPAAFDAHFQFGGHGGVSGQAYQNHRFRASAADSWQSFHGRQDSEYTVFDFAISLSGKEPPCLSSSVGGAQILGSNHAQCGYPNGASMFDAFGQDLRWQVLGFFDFIRMGKLIGLIQAGDWAHFAARYNGAANVSVYSKRLADAFAMKAQFDHLPRS